MNILQVIHKFPIGGGAGSENYTRQICDDLSLEHSVSILTRREPDVSNGAGEYCELKRINGFRYPVFEFLNHARDHDKLRKNYWNTDLDKQFTALCQEIAPDVIHIQHLINLSVSFLLRAHDLGIPIVMTLHDYWFLCPGILLLDQSNKPCSHWDNHLKCWVCQNKKSFGPKIFLQGWSYLRRRRKMMHHALNHCSRILAPSQTLLQLMINSGVRKSLIQYWPFGISTEAIRRSKTRDVPLHNPIRLGYVGTFSPQKGVDVLLEAFHSVQNQNVELRLYGRENGDNEIKKRISRWKSRYNDPRIQFKGGFVPEEIGRIHEEIDVLVVPSSWYENRPLVILEAFAAGNPVLGSNFGGVGELVGNLGSEWLFDMGSTAGLAAQIKNLLSNPELIRNTRCNIPPVRGIREECDSLISLYQSLV